MIISLATTTQNQPFCPKHTSKLLDIFCEDKMDKLKGILNHVLALTGHSLKHIRKVIKVTQKQATKVKIEGRKIKQLTLAAYMAIQGHVNAYVGEHVERHLASIDEYTRQSENMISETLDEQQTKWAKLKSIQLYGKHLSKGSAYDLNTNVRSLLKKAEEEVGKAVLELKWNVDVTWADWEVKDKVERVMLVKECQVKVESDQQLTTVTAQSLTHDHDDDQGVQQLNIFPTKCDNDVRGMVSYHDQMFLIHSWHDTLYVYDDTGKLTRSVQMFCHKNKSKMHTPYGMCLVQGEIDSLVISDNTGQCLWWLTTEKQASDVKLGQPRHHKLQYMPYGVSTDR